MSIHLHYKNKVDILFIMNVSKLLNEHFLKWQIESGERRKLKEFADYLGVGETMLNLIINNKKRPTRPFIIRCAERLADDRFYQLTGIIPPNSDLYYIQTHLTEISPTQARALREQMEKYITESLEP